MQEPSVINRLGTSCAWLRPLSTEVSALRPMRAVITALEEKSASLIGFWNFFKRRQLGHKIGERRALHDEIRSRLEELFDRRIKIESEQWPEFPGLSTEGKRLINIAVIALAQHLFVHFTEDSLAQHAKTAVVRVVEDVQYGEPEQCEYLTTKLRDALGRMPACLERAEELKLRTNYLRSAAKYRKDEDTVPMAESFPSIPTRVRAETQGATFADVPIEVNILAEEYWDIYGLVLK